eukprot:UN10833
MALFEPKNGLTGKLTSIAVSLWGANNERKMWSSPDEMAQHITSFYDENIKYYRNDSNANELICTNIEELYQFHLHWAKDNSIHGWINRIKRLVIDIDRNQIKSCMQQKTPGIESCNRSDEPM